MLILVIDKRKLRKQKQKIVPKIINGTHQTVQTVLGKKQNKKSLLRHYKLSINPAVRGPEGTLPN